MRIGPKIHDRVREKLKAGLGVDLPSMDTELKQSSIDRFFWAKGVKMVGYSGPSMFTAGGILSISQTLAAAVFIILKFAISGFPLVLPLLFSGFALASIAFTAIAYVRNRKSNSSEIRISSSGRKLLLKIGQHIGWYDHDSIQHQRGNPWGTWWQQIVGIKTASNVLTPVAADLLEQGCCEYNRIFGLLKLAKESSGRTTTLTPQIQAASDEAMISLINQVALLEQTPETQAAVVGQCQCQIDNLHELANRFEEMLSGPVTLADRLSSTTVMDSVLDQMRMEAQAHEELRLDN
jgi:hypothetical protein